MTSRPLLAYCIQQLLDKGGEVPSLVSLPSQTAFTLGFGGGVDLKASRFVWIRLVQADYLREYFSGDTQNDVRVWCCASDADRCCDLVLPSGGVQGGTTAIKAPSRTQGIPVSYALELLRFISTAGTR